MTSILTGGRIATGRRRVFDTDIDCAATQAITDASVLASRPAGWVDLMGNRGFTNLSVYADDTGAAWENETINYAVSVGFELDYAPVGHPADTGKPRYYQVKQLVSGTFTLGTYAGQATWLPGTVTFADACTTTETTYMDTYLPAQFSDAVVTAFSPGSNGEAFLSIPDVGDAQGIVVELWDTDTTVDAANALITLSP